MKMKRQTVGMRVKTAEKLKKLAKAYRVNQYVMLDVVINSIDIRSKAFIQAVGNEIKQKSESKRLSKAAIAAILAATEGRTHEEILEAVSKLSFDK